MTTLVTLVTLVIAIPAIMYNLYSPKRNILTIIGQRENSKQNNNPFESHAYNLHIFFFLLCEKIHLRKRYSSKSSSFIFLSLLITVIIPDHQLNKVLLWILIHCGSHCTQLKNRKEVNAKIMHSNDSNSHQRGSCDGR